jgi:hypothetical protein
MVRFPFIGLLVTVLLGVIICAGQSAAPKALSGRRKVVLNGLMAGLLVSGQVSAYLAPWTWSGLITWVLVLVPAAIICAWGVWSVTVRIAGRAPQAVIGIGFGLFAGVPLVVGGIQMARLAWPDLPRDPILSVVGVGSLLGAFTAAVLVWDRHPTRIEI